MTKDIMRTMVDLLNSYRYAYYNFGESSISDQEYDKLFDDLARMEEETGICYADSPTQTVGYKAVSSLKKIKHDHPLLSMGKTTNIDEFMAYFGDRDIMLMAKMDGLTCSVTYENGEIVHAETRGDGEEGEDITHNTCAFIGLPIRIPYKGRLVVDGECIVNEHDFSIINGRLELKYRKLGVSKGLTGERLDKFIHDNIFANPRSMASGAVRQLDSNVTKERKVRFYAWKLYECNDETDSLDTFQDRFYYLKKQGFEVVPNRVIKAEQCEEHFNYIEVHCKAWHLPIDGIVGTFDDVAYGESLGMTSHHPRHSLAFKFYQERHETSLIDIEWSVSRHGSVIPVAIFKPVWIDGTIVRRASLCNVSIIKGLELGYGDTIEVIKSNQIIPKITANQTKSNSCVIPDVCPSCGQPLHISKENDSEILVCSNPNCHQRVVDKLTNFCGKTGMDISGLSEKTIDKLVNAQIISRFADIYDIAKHEGAIIGMDGLGKAKVAKIIAAIEKSKNQSFDKFLVAIGIPSIGKTTAKLLSAHCEQSCNYGDSLIELFLRNCIRDYDWSVLDGIGEDTSCAINGYIQENYAEIEPLAFILRMNNNSSASGNKFNGKTFCITGKLNYFANRDALVAEIEKNGGKVVSGVTSNTDYLITNDRGSGSGKLKKAVQFGTKIISENDFLEM